jgi:hypothetical protein
LLLWLEKRRVFIPDFAFCSKKSDNMKKLAILAVLLLVIPSAFALVMERYNVQMQSNVITNGYEYAIVSGFNRNDIPVNIEHWHMKVELGQQYAFCEIQPTTVQPGPYMADIEVSCLTRSGLSSFFPKNTMVKIDKYVDESVPANSVSIESIKLETRVKAPVPFQVTKVVGEAVLDANASTAGSLMFLAGIGAIIILAVVIVLSSMRREE